MGGNPIWQGIDQPPLVSLEAEIVILGLSVDKRALEPKG